MPAAREGRGRLALLAGSLDGLRRPHPSRATYRRSALLLAAGAVLGVLAFVAIFQASGKGAAKTPTTPATSTAMISRGSIPSTSTTAPTVTASVTRHASPGNSQDNGKKKGKQ